MLAIYGVAPGELISKGSVLVEFPPFTGQEVGGAVPVDCKVGVVKLADNALISTTEWGWVPLERGYVVCVQNTPFSNLKNHLRRIRHLQDERGCSRVWPWFDPRYLKAALEASKGQDLLNLFGPVQAYGFAAQQGIQWYQLQAGALKIKQVLE